MTVFLYFAIVIGMNHHRFRPTSSLKWRTILGYALVVGLLVSACGSLLRQPVAPATNGSPSVGRMPPTTPFTAVSQASPPVKLSPTSTLDTQTPAHSTALAQTAITATVQAYIANQGKITFVSTRNGQAKIFWMRVDGSKFTFLGPDDLDHVEPSWSKDGTKLAYVGISLHPAGNANEVNAQIYISIGGKPGRAITSGVSHNSPSWAPDGAGLVFVTDEGTSGQLYTSSSDGTKLTFINADTGEDFFPLSLQPVWNPKRDLIAFIKPRHDGTKHIFLINPNGSNLHLLNSTTSHAQNPAWSPDGRRLAFDSNGQLYSINSDGSGEQQLTHDSTGRNIHPSWSLDGKSLVFASNRTGRFQIYLMPSNGGKARQVLSDDFDDITPIWSVS